MILKFDFYLKFRKEEFSIKEIFRGLTVHPNPPVDS